MRPDDPLAKREAVSAKDLENLPLILPRRTNVQNELSNWLGDSFQSIKVLFTSKQRIGLEKAAAFHSGGRQIYRTYKMLFRHKRSIKIRYLI